jgi:hypothetical protein
LTPGNIGKYLTYAIGEILLVVIGILIALQINNWNEGRKQKLFARKILEDINTSIKDNISYLSFSINYNQTGINSGELILNHFDENLPYNDSLDMHFSQAVGYSTPIIRNAGYESLKSYGLNIIENDSIVNGLIVFHNGFIETLVLRQEEYYSNTASPILTELFETVSMRSEMKPFNYDALRDSNEYRSVLKTSIAYKKDSNTWYKIWLQSIKELGNMIDNELKKP